MKSRVTIEERYASYDVYGNTRIPVRTAVWDGDKDGIAEIPFSTYYDATGGNYPKIGDVVDVFGLLLRVVDENLGDGAIYVAQDNRSIRARAVRFSFRTRKMLAIISARFVATLSIWRLAEIPYGVYPSVDHINVIRTAKILAGRLRGSLGPR